MIIGLSGTFASGKDTLAHHLVATRNFMHVSTSDMVRAVAESKYGSTERIYVHNMANELREKRGPGVLAKLSLEKYDEEKDKYDGVVISGVRSLGEVEAIKEAGGRIVFIDAPLEIRYRRAMARKRSNEEAQSFEEFKAFEESESLKVHDNPYVQDISGVKELADVIVFNEDDVAAYLKDAEEKLGFSS